MSKFESMKFALTKASAPLQKVALKHGHRLLMAAGIGGVVASGALLVKQTLSVSPLVNDHKIRLDEAKSESTPRSSDQAVATVYIRTAKDMVVHYGPAVSLGMAGVACMLVSNGILARRNTALMLAYQAAQSAFTEYRGRVRESLGEEQEMELYTGVRKTGEVTEEDGTVKDVIEIRNSKGTASPYARFFDEYSPYWQKNPEFNLFYLRGKQGYFNEYLNARGYVFLNEVYRELGIQETQVGNLVGWVAGSNNGDGYIDFGIYDLQNEDARAFVNGLERSILLDFNVDGVILDILDK